ncbi:MAG TPA: fatty acid desaturase [Bryobacteraceae bacterium]|nr:fatty acid desaturase [Bryobacteraceae bacterium]
MLADNFCHAQAHQLVRDLHSPRPLIYWTDLAFSAALGWAAFAVACSAPFGSWTATGAAVIAVLLLYRAVCFIHEITHVRPKALPGFETAWNVAIGIPLLMPSFTYVGVHQDHHSTATYGTSQDPEYMPFARSHLMTATFLLQSLLMPLLLLARFVVLAPFALFWRPFHRLLAAHASSFAMNPRYCRRVDDKLLDNMGRWEVAILLFWGPLLVLCATILPWRVLFTWAGVVAVVSFVNTLRALGAHHYESTGEPLDRGAQLLDSVDIPGGPWTALWAPVGLRYHALHHYFPGIPYHNLGRAHLRLTGELPAAARYRETICRSLPSSLNRLFVTGYRSRTRRHKLEAPKPAVTR